MGSLWDFAVSVVIISTIFIEFSVSIQIEVCHTCKNDTKRIVKEEVLKSNEQEKQETSEHFPLLLNPTAKPLIELPKDAFKINGSDSVKVNGGRIMDDHQVAKIDVQSNKVIFDNKTYTTQINATNEAKVESRNKGEKNEIKPTSLSFPKGKTLNTSEITKIIKTKDVTPKEDKKENVNHTISLNETDSASKLNPVEKADTNVTTTKDEKVEHKASEVDDMNKKEKYKGECDVDDDNHVANKTNSKKCIVNSTESSKGVESSTVHSDFVEKIPGFNSSGPVLIHEQADKPQADISNNVHLNSDKSAKTVAAVKSENKKADDTLSSFSLWSRNGVTIVIISLVLIGGFSYCGLLLHRKLAIRRHGREILINDEEFCDECTDSSQFEMDRPHNRNIII